MAQYQAGTSVGTYELRAEQALKAQRDLIKGYQDLAKAAGLKTPPIAAPAGTSNINAAALAQQRLATETQKTAAASNQAAKAAQALATEENKTAREAANTAAAQDRAAKSALNLASAQQRAAKQSQNGGLGPALPRTFAGFTPGGFNQALGAFGLATLGPQVVGQAISGGVEAGKNALLLDRTLKLTKELTGTQTLYNQVINAARTQQELYGGSLQENIAGIQGLVITSRSTGAELTTLINLSQRLAVLDPAQGAEGARIALSEVLSGDPRSLARRYEIPLSALTKIKDESVPVAERLKVLDQYLNKIGITSEVAANSVSDQAKAYNRLGVELSDLQTNTGRGLADFFEGAARGAGRLIGVINENPRAVAELKALLAGKGSIDQGDIDASARNLRVTNVSDAAENARKQQLTTAGFTSIGGEFGSNAATAQTAALEAARNRLIVFGATSDEARDKTVALLTAFGQTGNIEAFIQGVRTLETANTRGTKAIEDSAVAVANELAEKIKSQVETGKLAAQQKQLEADSFAAANGLLGAGDQALILAKKYGIATSEAQFLISAQQALSNASALAEQRAGERAPGGSGTAEVRASDDLQQQQIFARLAQPEKERLAAKAKEDAKKAAAEAERLDDARLQGRLINAKSAAQKIAVLQAQLAKTTDPVERQQLANQIDSERLSGSKKHTTELGKQLNLEERIRDSKEAQLKATLDASAAIIKDRQDRRKEDQEIKQAQRILGSGHASQQFKDAAADRLALIEIERQQRALDIAQKQATAGGTVINGKIFQSKPGGGIVPSGPVPIAGGSIAQAGAQGASVAGSGQAVTFRLVDQANRILATGIGPFIIADMQVGLAASQSAGS